MPDEERRLANIDVLERYRDAGTETDAILKPAIEAGRLGIEYGVALGEQVSLDALRKQFDAVLLAPGLGKGARLCSAPEGVTDAMTFLRQIKDGAIKSVPAAVAVLGGGNTAMDAAVAASHAGARDVYLLYRRSFAEMPAWPSERDHFLESGGHCMILTQPVGDEADENGKLAGVRVVRTTLGEPDRSGRRRPEPVAGSESVLKARLAIEALGQELTESLKGALSDLPLTEDGLIRTENGAFRTSLPRVYAAGDIVNGGTTAVQCISEGMRAADQIDADLRV